MRKQGRLPDYPGENPTKSVKERWCREAQRWFSQEQQCALRNMIPAKLEAETEGFDLSQLDPLKADAVESTVAARQRRV